MRGKSVSVSASATPYDPFSSPSSPTRPTVKPLKKTSSLADLKIRPGGWLKRLKSKSSLEFGCAGEHREVYEEEDDQQEFEETVEAQESESEDEIRSALHNLKLYSAPPTYAEVLPSSSSRPSSADARAEMRRIEEARALDAIASYMAEQHCVVSPPPRLSSKQKQPLMVDTSSDDTVVLPYLRPVSSDSRSSTASSSEGSSSNRDSLPSYHTGSEPASPRYYGRRPSLTPAGTTPPLPLTPSEVPAGSRPYAFI